MVQHSISRTYNVRLTEYDKRLLQPSKDSTKCNQLLDNRDRHGTAAKQPETRTVLILSLFSISVRHQKSIPVPV